MNRMMISSGSPTRPSMSPSSSCSRGRLRDLITLVAATVLTLATAAASAQFTSRVNVVEVYAAVTDRNGQPVGGLTRGDFTVLEDGQPQTIDVFAEGEFPLAVAVAIDRSFSMSGERLALARAAARTFLETLRPSDRSMVVAVGSEVDIIAPLSESRASQIDAISKLEPWGTTGLYDAVIRAIDRIQSSSGRRALVLLSDGNDRYGQASAADALARARRSDVMIYPVALGRERPPVFSELAALTGGRSFQARKTPELTSVMQTIANELRRQYLLGYSPTRPFVPGEEQWRSITVRVNRPDVTVRARDGYVAK
jgi:Ca-activated chloride channel family protein